MSQLCVSMASCLRIYNNVHNPSTLKILTLKNPMFRTIHSNVLLSAASRSGYESGSTTDEEDKPKKASRKVNLNSDNLGQILGMSRPSVLKLMSKKPGIRSANPDYLCGTNNVFKANGFQPEELLQSPDLFLMTPNAVENYILIFNESGFTDLRPHYVLNYRELTKKSINVLKEAGLIPNDLNVVQHYCDQFQMKEDCVRDMWAALPESYEQLSSLADVRVLVLKYFLVSGLNCDSDAADKIIKTYRRFRNRSFKWIKQNIEIATERLKFPLEKIQKHAYLLLTNPANSLEILDKLPELGGRPVAEVINLRPKIFCSQVTSLQEISRLFDEHGIGRKVIAKYPEVYTLSPTTVRRRLEEFKKIPEFEVLKNHPRVGRLIYYQNKIKKRLEFLQTTHQVYNSSLHILSTDRQHFEIFLRHGEMRPKGDDNVQLVSTQLNLPKTVVRKLLVVQPHWRDISPVSINSVINYLTRTKSFTVEQLKHALPVILYPLDKVMANVRLVEESNEAVETDLYFLQMVLYFMEKKGHFSGAGVWNNENKPEKESDPVTVNSTQNPDTTASSIIDSQVIKDPLNYPRGSNSNLVQHVSRVISIDDHITCYDDVDDVTEFNENKIDLDTLEFDDDNFDEDAIIVSKYGKVNRTRIDDLALHRFL